MKPSENKTDDTGALSPNSREVIAMAKTDVWMPLYIGDYLSNTGRLTTEQHGAYFLLIMDYWVSGRLPDDDQSLASITRLPIDRWGSIRPALERFFKIQSGEWIHERIEEEKEKAEYLSRVRAEAGSKGGSKTKANWKQNQGQNDKPCPTPSQSPSPLQSEAPPQSNKKDIVSQATPSRFDDFWALYPVHREKQKSKEIWNRRKLDDMADTILHDISERQKRDTQWKDGYIPHPTTYLRNSRWEDEYGKPGKKDGYQEFLERHDAR